MNCVLGSEISFHIRWKMELPPFELPPFVSFFPIFCFHKFSLSCMLLKRLAVLDTGSPNVAHTNKDYGPGSLSFEIKSILHVKCSVVRQNW